MKLFFVLISILFLVLQLTVRVEVQVSQHREISLDDLVELLNPRFRHHRALYRQSTHQYANGPYIVNK
jgi:hypothetical protein